ncbi:MAG TPA: glutamine--fructose-6-phosphate transaminase (isomerizing) [Firmicutes bacterium]|nr:glutamine--fructose-6-phosphate transaminase (isomerizing) [Bacillota bacterium]
MCGIVGYIGYRPAAEVLVDGLRRLEYRGYDSAGVACTNNIRLEVAKSAGRLDNLVKELAKRPLEGQSGIAHTRWATHGAPTDINAHPHTDCTGTIGVVHNGIIENYLELKAWLIEKGHKFSSETDSEILAHLIEEFAVSSVGGGSGDAHGARLYKALTKALSVVSGSYALVVLDQHQPDLLLAARQDSPLIIGLGEGENFLASDMPAIIKYTRRMMVLEDGDVAVVGREKVMVQKLDGLPVERHLFIVDWDPGRTEKEGYDHFMLKEIHEQPAALRAALAGRVGFDTGGKHLPKLEQVLPASVAAACREAVFVAAGTAYHAGYLGREWWRRWTDLPVQAELASEFRYHHPHLDRHSLVVIVSQSGETADTLAALREAKRRGAVTLAVTNVVGSSVAREADYVLYTQAGPEIAVASTKAYTSQLACLALTGIYIASTRGEMDQNRAAALLGELLALNGVMREMIPRLEPEVREVAVEWGRTADVYYIGRGLDYPLAMEGQLKLKEISYIHAEALAAGELKHGTLALITEGTPVVALATQPQLFDKMVSNIKEVKARGAEVLLLTGENNRHRPLVDVADKVIYLPEVDPDLMPIIAAVPLQLLAYYAAVNRGCDVDHPRNLAKSVTVE